MGELDRAMNSSTNHGEPALVKKIIHAYEILSSRSSRKEYDMSQLQNNQSGFVGNGEDENENSCQDLPLTPIAAATSADIAKRKKQERKKRRDSHKKEKNSKRKTSKANGGDSDALQTTSSTITPIIPKLEKRKEKSRKRSSSPNVCKNRNSLVPDYSKGYRTATKTTTVSDPADVPSTLDSALKNASLTELQTTKNQTPKKRKEKSRKRSSSPNVCKNRNSLVPDYSEGYRTATKTTSDANGKPVKTFTYKRSNKDGTTTVDVQSPDGTTFSFSTNRNDDREKHHDVYELFRDQFGTKAANLFFDYNDKDDHNSRKQ